MQHHTTTPNVGPAVLGPVRARDLHAGDIVQQCDWALHVRAVTLSPADVTIAVTEFEFPLHYAADEPIQLVA
ncbi:MAG TPA: hypothetical protein VH373_06830 [Jatrophihabitantaceae bacterium]|jgi:hypothetical protein